MSSFIIAKKDIQSFDIKIYTGLTGLLEGPLHHI